ncbi:hypothetical protein T492DRAFT_850543 [Pavlovales sp. CCMP2436]|nr:hypothetical protein T492DRAFT_850543 [Pavlovales sp. CCMP2436]
MSDTVERNTQVGRALTNANVSGKRVSGIYIIWPGWSKVPFMKLGLTTNIYSRAMNGYSHYMPFADPGRSFDLVGYMVMAPSLVRARETSVLNLASKQNGWETPPHDKEWRCWLGASGDVYMAIAKLLATLRTIVDGLWYTFERGTGKILMQGGCYLSFQTYLPGACGAETRSEWWLQVWWFSVVKRDDRCRCGQRIRGIRTNNPKPSIAIQEYFSGISNAMGVRRFEMKVRPRIGVVFDGKEGIASITCTGCGGQKTSNEMNHRRRKTGEITITNKCGTCYRTQARLTTEDPDHLGTSQIIQDLKNPRMTSDLRNDR